MLTSTALVLLMIPGLAMFYGGLVRTKNVLGTMMHSFSAMAIIGVIWTVCGYAMAFGDSIGGVVGWDPSKVMPLGSIRPSWTAESPSTSLPCSRQVRHHHPRHHRAFAERVQFRGYCVFIALWSLLIYNPLAHIVWGGGFLTGDAIDFAGGTVIHVSAGVAGLVAALYLIPPGLPAWPAPNSLVMTMIGAGLLWVGWPDSTPAARWRAAQDRPSAGHDSDRRGIWSAGVDCHRGRASQESHEPRPGVGDHRRPAAITRSGRRSAQRCVGLGDPGLGVQLLGHHCQTALATTTPSTCSAFTGWRASARWASHSFFAMSLRVV